MRNSVWIAAALMAVGLSAGVAQADPESKPVQVAVATSIIDYDQNGRPIWGNESDRPQTSSGVKYTPIPREIVDYNGPHSKTKGAIVVNTAERRLYLMLGDGKALRYGIGVGRPGFTWGGSHSVTRKAEWPGWTPPPAMRKRQPHLPAFMAGGPENPLGARAMYIGSTIYRIHGSNEPWTIGQSVSSGCFRMTNDDVTDLYERVKVGARVVVVN
ncbi:MAG: L,D-transpeptidase [Hyphomicrobiaceae bacterium]|nr:L,D-transpeptidase [Hyphomicrobiaceae bacterium]